MTKIITKTCSTCDWMVSKWWGLSKQCSNHLVISRLDPIYGNPVPCHVARFNPTSPCGVYGSCYHGEAEIAPPPTGFVTGSSSFITASYVLPMMSSIIGFGAPYRSAFSAPADNRGVESQDAIEFRSFQNSNSEESTPSGWEGGGGEFNGGGASGDWSESSDSGDSGTEN